MVKRRHLLANSILCFLTFSILGFGQTLSTVRDTVKNPDGSTFSGLLQITWTGGAGSSISPTTTSARLNTGVFTALLVPTTTVTPCAYYVATFTSSNGVYQWTQNWYVPPSSTVLNIAAISTPNSTCGGGGTSGPPSAPSNLAASAFSTSQVNLTWSASSTSGVTYNVYVSNVPALTATSPYRVAAGVSSTGYQVTGLSAGTTYYFLVTASNSAGESTASNMASVATQSPAPPLPVAPSALTAAATSSSQVNLSWTASPTTGVTYNVYASTSAGVTATATYKIASGLSSTSFQNTGLQALTTYYYLVTATNSAGESLASNLTSATTQAPQVTVPSPPSWLGATAASSSQINLSWTASSTGGVTYNVYASTSAGVIASASYRIASGLSSTNYQNTGLQASTTYYYLVTAVNAAGESVASNLTSASTQASSTLPLPPTGVNATSVSSSQINLSWTASATNGVTYNVYASTASGVTATAPNRIAASLSSTGYNDTGLQGSTTYYFVVTAANSAGESVASSQAQATTGSGGTISVPIPISDVTNLSTTLATLTTDDSTNTASLATTNSNVTALTTSLATTNSNVTALTTNLGTTNANVSLLTTGLATTNSNLTALNANLTSTNSTVTALSTTVAALPTKGSGYAPSTIAFINSSGNLTSITGTASNCIHVDGSTGSCGGGSGSGSNSLSVSFIDGETPGGTLDGSNTSFTLAQAPSPATSLEIFRNGAIQQVGTDFTLNGTALTFLSAPQPGDMLMAYYRVNGTAQTVTFVDGEIPGGTMDGVNTAYTLANVPIGGLRIYRNGTLLQLNSDYTISGSSITFVNGAQPFPSDILLAYYRH